MFWPLKMSHSFIQNCCWITLQVSHHEGWKTCVKKWKVKLIFRGAWKSLMDWPDWPWPAIFYDRSPAAHCVSVVFAIVNSLCKVVRATCCLITIFNRCSQMTGAAYAIASSCYNQCLKWSKKEAGSLTQSEVEWPSPEFFNSFLIWKWRVLMHYWWHFMRFRATRE